MHGPHPQLRRYVIPAAVGLALLVLGALLYLHTLDRPISDEDAFWLGGGSLGSPLRLTQRFVLHLVLQRLAPDQPLAYHLPGVLIHLANAYLLYLVVALFCRDFVARARLWSHAGGAVAGLALLFHDVTIASHVSALSYQLVVLCCLAGLLSALLYLRSPRWPLWFGVVLAYGLALASHSYAVGLPVMILALELTLLRRRGQAVCWRRLAPRYLALLALLLLGLGLVFALAYQPGTYDRVTAQTLVLSLQNYPRYLLVGALHFCGVDRHLDMVPGWPSWVALAGVIGVGWLGLRQLLRARPELSLLGCVVLWGLLWNGLALAQTMVTYNFMVFFWRYYFNAVGFGVLLVLAYGLALSALGRRVPHRPLVVVVTLGLALGLLLHHDPGLSAVKALVHGPLWPQLPPWARQPRCASLQRLTVAEARAAGQALRCKDLRHRQLQGADLRAADLSGSSLSVADLRRADLRGARLDQTLLRWADLRQARLDRAQANGAVLRWARLERANLASATLRETQLSGANLSHADLTGARIIASNISGAKLHMARLDRAVLQDVMAMGTELLGASLRGADLQGVRLMGCNLSGADLRQADLRRVFIGGGSLAAANLSGADLRGCGLFNVDLSRANLSGADLRGCKVANLKLEGANLAGARSDQPLLRPGR